MDEARSMTIAQQIAAALGNDGSEWRTRPTDDSDPVTFTELVARHGGSDVQWRDGWRTGDVCRHVFSDGSIITEAGSAWDFGFPACFCWAGAVEQEGHRCGEDGRG
jgi:hypothetical protein